jgi:hypothetical protein
MKKAVKHSTSQINFPFNAKRGLLFFSFLIFLGYVHVSNAQEIISINIRNRCIFTGGAMDNELYRFEQNNLVLEWVQEILDLGGAEHNFELIQTNVENVTAVVDENRRYLLYSLDFIQHAKRIHVYAALAHEIGHHAHEHTLLDTDRDVEESEADFFMGYILSKKGFEIMGSGSVGGSNYQESYSKLLEKLPSSYGIDDQRRLKSILVGYHKADQSLTIKSLQVDNDPRLNDLLLPTFSFMDCYTATPIDRNQFAGLHTLGMVSDKICRALHSRGYRNRSYFSVKNGFALVTQMEQYNHSDATSRSEPTRWLSNPVRENFPGILDDITSAIWPNKGYFRIFVFVVTDSPYRSSGEKVSKKDAEAWLSKGAQGLPKDIAGKPFSGDHSVSILVYEFEVPESTLQAKQICPTPYFDAETHLKRAGIGF